MKKREIAEIVLIAVALIGAIGGFASIDRAIHSADTSVIVVPAIWFSFFVIAISLLTLIAHRRVFILATLFAGFFVSFFFAIGIMQLLIVFVGWGIATFGIAAMKRDLVLSLHISALKSVGVGLQSVIFGLCIVIAGQYYWSVKDFSVDELLPRLEQSSVFEKFLQQTTDSLIPFNAIDSENAEPTVDDYLRSNFTLADSSADAGPLAQVLNRLPGGANLLSELPRFQPEVLDQARKNLSDAFGIELFGNEPLREVLPELVRAQIRNAIVQNAWLNSFLPEFLTVPVFIVAFSLGSLLRFVWLPCVQLLFMLLRKTGVIRIKIVQRDAEMIA